MATSTTPKVQNYLANRALVAWHRMLRDQVIIDIDEASQLRLTAEDPSSAATALFNHIVALCAGGRPQETTGVHIQNCTWHSLMASQRRFRMCVPLSCSFNTAQTSSYFRGSGVGQGPQTSTFVALAKHITSNQHHWVLDDEGHFIPLIMSFTPSDHDLLMFRAYGAVMRLLLIWKQGFLPFSPALLMYLVEGFEAATDLNFLKLVAPQIADRLATWPPPLEVSGDGGLQPAFVLGKDPMNMVFQVLPNLQVDLGHLRLSSTDAIVDSLTP
jgi:hypothetical protein